MTTIAPAIVIGVGVLLAGALPWGAIFAPLNLRFWPELPWAIVPMLIYLWLYWAYLDGRLEPTSSAISRRSRLRANRVSPDVWPMALATGVVGFGAMFALLAVMARLMHMPQSPALTTPPEMPGGTAFLLLVMSSVVAGLTEEAGFRGYMQGPIERRHGVVLAIVLNGIMFGLLHFPNHPGVQTLAMLPFYVTVAAVYGGVTWATNSILPSVVLHSVGDVWSLTRQWASGRAEWQLTEAAPPLVWNSGIDAPFLVAVTLLVVLATAATLMCRSLRSQTDRSNTADPAQYRLDGI